MYIIDIYCKFAWVVPLKDKEDVTVTNALQKILDESGCQPNKIWVNKGSEFYNRLVKPWLEDNGMEMYSTHSEEKSVAIERFARTLKNKTYKYMTSISKNVFIVDDMANTYYNTYHSQSK